MSQTNDKSDTASTELEQAIEIRNQFELYEEFGSNFCRGPDGEELHTTASGLCSRFDGYADELEYWDSDDVDYQYTVDEMVSIAEQLEFNYL